jgi:antitoxin (DNA-binding transcriptional repressor) of toxin-antitoxin stability system
MSNRRIIVSMAVIHISEEEAARDFPGLLKHVRLGAEVVIEHEARAVAVVRPAVSAGPGRLLSELIAAAESRGSSVLLDGGFARDVEEAVAAHREPLNPPSWD